MATGTGVSPNSQLRVSLSYFAGAIPRVLGATFMAMLGFIPLAYLRLAENARLGSPPMNEQEAIATIAISALVAGLPILITLVIVECQLLIWRGVGWSFRTCLVVFPLVLAGLGGLLGALLFHDPGEPADVRLRLFALGGGLVLFLAGSFHLWFWQMWYDSPESTTPFGWYIAALWISAAFLGSMIAWEAPSPMVRAVIEYHGESWHERPTDPPMSLPAESMSPTY